MPGPPANPLMRPSVRTAAPRAFVPKSASSLEKQKPQTNQTKKKRETVSDYYPPIHRHASLSPIIREYAYFLAHRPTNIADYLISKPCSSPPHTYFKLVKTQSINARIWESRA